METGKESIILRENPEFPTLKDVNLREKNSDIPLKHSGKFTGKKLTYSLKIKW